MCSARISSSTPSPVRAEMATLQEFLEIYLAQSLPGRRLLKMIRFVSVTPSF